MRDDLFSGDCFGKLVPLSTGSNLYSQENPGSTRIIRRNSNSTIPAASTFLHLEAAVAITECQIGIIICLPLARSSTAREKAELVQLLKSPFPASEEREDDHDEETEAETSQTNMQAILSGIHNRMGLSNQLSTVERMKVVQQLRRVSFKISETGKKKISFYPSVLCRYGRKL